MPDFPILRNTNAAILSPAGNNSIGPAMNAMGQGLGAIAWATANKAYYIPFSVQAPVIAVKMFVINGATASGNIDVGIYDAGGAKIVTSGSAAQTGTSVIQEFDITDTTLNPGLYYLSCAMNTTAGTLEMWTPTSSLMRMVGVCEQTTAFPLPATATFALVSGTSRVPYVAATLRTVV